LVMLSLLVISCLVAGASALAGFDCTSTASLGCSGTNFDYGCCHECIATVIADNKSILAWEANKMADNGWTQAQVDAYEGPDVVWWGSPSLHNCLFCAGQCWDNSLQNIDCQISQSNPFGSKREVVKINPIKTMRRKGYEKVYPALAAAHASSMAALYEAIEGKRSVKSMCDAQDESELFVIIPFLDVRPMCDANCILVDMTSAATPIPTPNPGQIGPAWIPTPQPTFGTGTVYSPPGPSSYVTTTSEKVVTIPNAPPPPSNAIMGTSGSPCTTENAQCGMAGNTKLFCKCKVCGFSGTVCPASVHSISLLAVAVAVVVVASSMFM